MILMELMLEVAMRVMDMEDDKVADMVLKIPDDNFTDVTVSIGDMILMEMMLEVMRWVLDMEADKGTQPDD